MLKLVDGILKLFVQYEAICNHNDAVEYNLVIFIVQVRQVMCQPRNRVGFSASRTVLNQIIVSGSVCVDIGNELADHIQLVVTWEDHNRLFRILFIFLQMDKSLYNVQQAVFLQDFFPQIRSPVGAVPNRVSLAAVVSLIERQKIGIDAIELCGHPHFFGVHGKVNQASSFERKQKFSGITVFHVLTLCIFDSLTGDWIFQFHRRNRQSIDEQHNIYGVLIFQAIMHLPGDGENVLLIECLTGLVHAAGRLEIAQR